MTKVNKIKLIAIGILVFLYMSMAFCIQSKAENEEVIVLEPGSTAKDIQAALSRNSQNDNIHLTVKVPAGEYNLEKGLYMYSNTTLEADKDAKFYNPNKLKVMLSSYNYDYDKGRYDHIKNVVVSGGQWDAGDLRGEVIRFIHGTNITLSGITVRNVGDKSHMLTFAGVKDGVIEGCNLSGYHGSHVKEAIHLDVVHNDDWVPGTVTYDDTANENIIIRNNVVTDYKRAVGSHSAVKGVYHKNIVIENNTFTGTEAEAIQLYGYKDTKVLNNTIDNVGTGIRVYTKLENGKQEEPLSNAITEEIPKSYHIEIRGNNITNAKNYGVQLIGAKDQPLCGVEVTNNICNNIGNNGIMLYLYCNNNIIKNNQIIKPNNQGIVAYISCNANQMISNTIQQPKKMGIYIGKNSVSNVVKSNKIVKSKKHGIWIDTNSHKTKIVSNVISNPAEMGIGMQSCNQSSIINNKITASKKIAVYAKDCNKLTVKSNKYTKITGKQEYIV